MRVPTFSIRPAQPDDVPALYLLKWQLAFAEESAFTVRASEADWRRDMFGPHPRFSAVVAEVEGSVIGMATVIEKFAPGWVGPLISVNDLFVVPEQRGRGIGKALLARVAAQAKELGAPYVELTVRERNPACRLYRRVGFERVRGALTLILAGHAFAELASACDQAMFSLL
jgi:ribosomal protein S18 acetylase RimI-like enzyme